MPTDYKRYIPEYQGGGITPVSTIDDLPEVLKAYYTANPIDWTATGTAATMANVTDLLAAAETPAVTSAVIPESTPTTQYTTPTAYELPASDTTNTAASVITETPVLTPNASTLTDTTASPSASTYQSTAAYDTKKKKSKLPYDSVLFQGQTSEIL